LADAWADPESAPNQEDPSESSPGSWFHLARPNRVRQKRDQPAGKHGAYPGQNICEHLLTPFSGGLNRLGLRSLAYLDAALADARGSDRSHDRQGVVLRDIRNVSCEIVAVKSRRNRGASFCGLNIDLVS
jgi:hypothetical protein